MRRVMRWLMSILEAGVWRGAAAAEDRYQDWRTPPPPPRGAAAPAFPIRPKPSSPPASPRARRPQAEERKSA